MENRIDLIKENSNSFLTFYVGEELYASHVANILSILEVPRLTKVPECPDFITGVMNYREAVLPVVDMRIKFGMLPTKKTNSTCVLAIDIENHKEIIKTGVLVDAVGEVTQLDASKIMPVPAIDDFRNSDFIYGMVDNGDQLIMLLDINLILTKKEIRQVNKQLKTINEVEVKS